MTNDDEPQPLFSREEVAKKIGVSVSHLRRMENTGRVTPIRGKQHNKALFTVDQVRMMAETFPRKFHSKADRKAVYTREDAMKVFALIEEGVPHEKIALQVNLHPRCLLAIISDYATLSGSKLISGYVMAEINSLPLDAVFPIDTAEEILTVLTAYSKDRCSNCGKRPKHICKRCARAMAEDSDL